MLKLDIRKFPCFMLEGGHSLPILTACKQLAAKLTQDNHHLSIPFSKCWIHPQAAQMRRVTSVFEVNSQSSRCVTVICCVKG